MDIIDILGYILSRTGCIHPFRISRIIGLAELLYLEEKGERLTNLKYYGFNKVFYIEGLKEVIKKNDCFVVREGDPSRGIRGCIEYVCNEPVLKGEVKEFLDKALARSADLSDEELNQLVVEHPLFSKLLSNK
ncbi:MAG: hypothetical protein B6U89_06090 [Desulfurococcales archaeon ex4484_58]|nr:MAG: hypothetical protein B6U89_06090 [Desulfurococcales archaeon ex4484_58]